MSECFPELKLSEGRIKVELDFLKNETGVDTSKFAKKLDLTSLKPNVDELDIAKLKSVPSNLSNSKSKTDKLDVDKLVPALVDLNKLSNVVKTMLLKRMYIM